MCSRRKSTATFKPDISPAGSLPGRGIAAIEWNFDHRGHDKPWLAETQSFFDLFLHGFPPFPTISRIPLRITKNGEFFEVAQSIPKSCMIITPPWLLPALGSPTKSSANHGENTGQNCHCHSGKDLMCCILLGHNHVVLSPAMLPAVSRQCTKKMVKKNTTS